MNTKIKVEFFKNSGKFYTSFEFETEEKCFETNKIKKLVIEHKDFLSSMNFTIEVQDLKSEAWNKYLFIVKKQFDNE